MSMTTEEAKGVIVEGIKFPLPSGVKTKGELEEYLKKYLDDIPLTNDLTCVVKENLMLYHKSILFNFIKLNTSAMYRGVKIRTKGLYNQSKNKFTIKVVKKLLPKPIDITTRENPDDKYSINVDMTFNIID